MREKSEPIKSPTGSDNNLIGLQDTDNLREYFNNGPQRRTLRTRRNLNSVGSSGKRSSGNNSVEDGQMERPVYVCQSCQISMSDPRIVPINLHHQDDAFYSKAATSTSQVKSSIAQVLSDDLGNSALAHAINWGFKEMVSLEPTTLAIPVESVVLCEECAHLFKMYRLQCDECYYIPRKDELYMKDCCHCFEGVICRQ
ncbi:hypothetical protein MIR68_010410 [Amoeboaphelidium protococcarum]|nr:hypothetical protein MIR68_010410 [Amoeboaphelidium protococcarum]